MALNTSHANGGVLIHAGESILLFCDNVDMEFSGQDSKEFKGRIMIYAICIVSCAVRVRSGVWTLVTRGHLRRLAAYLRGVTVDYAGGLRHHDTHGRITQTQLWQIHVTGYTLGPIWTV